LLTGQTHVAVTAALGHDWGEWVVTGEPTEYAEGEMTRVCKNDPSHKETKIIPKIEKNPMSEIPYIPFIPLPVRSFRLPVLFPRLNPPLRKRPRFRSPTSANPIRSTMTSNTSIRAAS
jgi:hypothetical protein